MNYDERMMNGLGVLGAVVDSGSFARAGVALGISPSAVSRAISRLEERLGIRLFERTTRALTLTEEGRALCDRVMPLLAGLEAATSSASQGSALVRGRLRVNIGGATCAPTMDSTTASGHETAQRNSAGIAAASLARTARRCACHPTKAARPVTKSRSSGR
jgi:DNA-binding transcriptional LysR family regulator